MHARQQALYQLSYMASFELNVVIQSFMFGHVFFPKIRHYHLLTKFKSLSPTTEEGREMIGLHKPNITELLLIQETSA